MKTRHISYLFWILTLLLALPASAQKMTVESMVHDPFDQTANLSENMYKDNNQEYGGLVKVMVAAPNATFEGWVLKQQTHSASEYWVFMAKGSDRLKVTVPGYLPLEVDFNNYDDCIVKSLHTYILTITLPQAAVAGPVDDGMRYLAMTVEPKNCTVLVDGQPQMVEDGNVMVILPRGTHRYQVSATGYNTEEGTVELKDGKETLSIRLKSSMATLRVECPTSGAKIYVNDLQRGTAPWNGSFVAGIYKVEARLDGYRSQQQSVTLSENENRTLRLPALEMIIGSLDVKVSPINSDVYVDGKKIGTTPDVFRDIQVGQHRVEIRKEGYETLTKTVTINENEQASVTGTLTAVVAATPSTSSTFNDIEELYQEILLFSNFSPSTSYLSCPDNNHPHMIGLGLPSGTKWACCNVGANKPEANGDYYAWGETETKSVYYWDTYVHWDDSGENCHNIGSDIAGTQYDVAHVKWGGSWVMPSRDQIKELDDNCSYEWTTANGVKGGKFTSKKNGASIFLPAAGGRDDSFRDDSGLHNAGSHGYYWSSTRNPSSSNDAYSLRFNSGIAGWDHYYGHFYGHTVRPVSR